MGKETVPYPEQNTHFYNVDIAPIPPFKEVRAELVALVDQYSSNIERACVAHDFADTRRKDYGVESTDETKPYMYSLQQFSMGAFLDSVAIIAAEKTFNYINEDKKYRGTDSAHSALIELVDEKKSYQQRLFGFVQSTPESEYPILHGRLSDNFEIAKLAIINDSLRNPLEENPVPSRTMAGILSEYKAVHALRESGYPHARYSTIEEDLIHDKRVDVVVPVYRELQFVDVGLQIKTARNHRKGDAVVIHRRSTDRPEIHIPHNPKIPFGMSERSVSRMVAFVEELARSA